MYYYYCIVHIIIVYASGAHRSGLQRIFCSKYRFFSHFFFVCVNVSVSSRRIIVPLWKTENRANVLTWIGRVYSCGENNLFSHMPITRKCSRPDETSRVKRKCIFTAHYYYYYHIFLSKRIVFHSNSRIEYVKHIQYIGMWYTV